MDYELIDVVLECDVHHDLVDMPGDEHSYRLDQYHKLEVEIFLMT